MQAVQQGARDAPRAALIPIQMLMDAPALAVKLVVRKRSISVGHGSVLYRP